MWITDDVELPEELLEAQADGELVVFVGAGVSMGPPSNLPSFDRLAKLVSQRLQLPEYDEVKDGGPDAYLGRLQLEHLPMRDHVVQIVGSAGTSHNGLHAAIVQLFKNVDSVRIVTTNYDDHLRSAAVEYFGGEPKVYCAPAIPLGRDFTGIVHVHGALSGRPEDLIITSTDFGQAYLTDAWAARFLVDLFGRYKTLFIGYSHNDVVMAYLARGLRPGSDRWGLMSTNQDQVAWQPLGVAPIVYPHTSDHAALTYAVAEWSSRSSMGALAHRQRIAELMENGEPQTPSDIDYLDRAIADDDYVDFFIENATDIKWLDWVAHRSPFEALFHQSPTLSKASTRLGWWFADFATAGGDRTLLSVLEHGRSLHPETAQIVAQRLSHSRPDAISLGRWMALLLQVVDRGVQVRLGYVLEDSRWPDDRDVAIQLLDHLTERTVALGQGFSTPTNRLVRFTTNELRGSIHSLERAWHDFFKPHLDELAPELVTIFAYQLEKAHRLQYMVGQGGEDFDLDSYSRSSIDDDPQNDPGWPFDFVLDALRDCMHSMAETEPAELAQLIERFETSRSALLRRFALFGWAIRLDVSADEKLDHLRTSKVLFDFSERREVFRLIELAVPEATDSIGLLVDAVLQGPNDGQKISPESDRQRIVDLLAQVHVLDETSTALAEFLAKNPGPGPSEHLGYDRWMGPAGFSVTFPVSVERLLQVRSVEELATTINDALSDPQNQPWDFRLPQAISTAAAENPQWARLMLDSLVTTQNWTTPLWDHLFWGLSRNGVELDEDFLSSLCGLLLDLLGVIAMENDLPGSVLGPLSQFLMMVSRRPHPSIELIDRLERVGSRAAELVNRGPAVTVGDDPNQVHMEAYNQWTGWLARFWIATTSLRWAADEASWSGLPEQTKHMLELLLIATEDRSVFPESILCGSYDFLASADEDWTLEHVRPLFNFDREGLAPARAWSSFCEGVTLNERAIRHMRTDFVRAATELRGKVGDQFVRKFAEVVVRSSADFLTDNTLAGVVAHLDDELRQAFAHMVEWLLQHNSAPSFAADQWPRWINQYFAERLASTPLPFSRAEAAAMFGWVVSAGEHFPAAVAQYIQTDPYFAESYGVWSELKNRNLAQLYPKPLIDLIAFVLERSNRDGFFSCTEVSELLEQLLPELESEWVEKLLAICEFAAQLHCSEAPSWVERVLQRASELES